MMKEPTLVCENCCRTIGRLERKLLFNQYNVCDDCYTSLTDNLHAASRKGYCPYHWLRMPATLIASIGITGILVCTVSTLKFITNYVNVPSVPVCYGIIGGAMVLYIISMIKTQKHHEMMKMADSQARRSWRSM